MNMFDKIQRERPLAGRGYILVYREGEVNRCPGCGRSQWHIGRISAECAFCATAIPLADAHGRGHGTHSRNRRPVPDDALWAA